MTFRSDINGLRAWAVMAVILYHFGLPGFSGGFIGVDVFFVISGYLMTSIVIKGLEVGGFSVLSFYAARVRRIVPALLVLCTVILLIGYFVLAPLDYKTLATHVISALGFFSNIKFWSEAGYFDVASHDKWLLHTWSLSVEWQFYLLLPIALATTWRLRPGRSAQLWVVLFGGALSFAASVLLTAESSSSAFYLLPARAWEMLAGGLVFLLARHLALGVRAKAGLEFSGFALIVLSILLFDGLTPWPGWRAAIPVLGAMMILGAHRERSIWTTFPSAQWLGDRSYSLYLWHWPMVVALAFIEQRHNPLAIAAGIAATFLLGHASCQWVELPIRRYTGRLSPRRFWGVVCFAVAVPATLAVAVRLAHGIEGRLGPEVESVAAASSNVNPRRDQCHTMSGRQSQSCVWGGEEWRVLALGDSHTSATVTALSAAGGQQAGVVQWSYSGCSYVLGLKTIPEAKARQKNDYSCEGFIQWVAERLDELPADMPVVIVNRYAANVFGANEDGKPTSRPDVYFSIPYEQRDERIFAEYANAIVQTACHAAKRRKVYLVRPIPEMGFDVPKVLSRRLGFGFREDVSIPRTEYLARNHWVWKAQDEAGRLCGVTILDPTEQLCDTERCYGSRDLQPIYNDDDHLSETGNKLLVPMFSRVFAESPIQPRSGGQ